MVCTIDTVGTVGLSPNTCKEDARTCDIFSMPCVLCTHFSFYKYFASIRLLRVVTMSDVHSRELMDSSEKSKQDRGQEGH